MRKTFSILCCISFMLSACSSFYEDEARELGPLPEISCVAVLPTAVPITYNDTLTAEGKKNISEGAAFLDTVLNDELGNRAEFQVLTQNQLDAIIGDLWSGRIQQINDVGRATKCGAVLEVSLNKYRERVGTAMSVENPAAASFSLELIEVEKGVVLWVSSFDETQKALFKDIFSFSKAQKRGFKWLSVEELSRDGMRGCLTGFPYFQKAEME